MKRGTVVVISIVGGLIALAAIAVVVGVPAFIVVAEGRHRRAMQQTILYRMDHAKLLAACREILSNQKIYAQNPDWNGLAPGDTSCPDPADPAMPAVIGAMPSKPNITILDHSVRLEMGGGFFHWGIEGFEAGIAGSGDKELVPGLFFYAEDGRVPPP